MFTLALCPLVFDSTSIASSQHDYIYTFWVNTLPKHKKLQSSNNLQHRTLSKLYLILLAIASNDSLSHLSDNANYCYPLPNQ